MMWREVASAFGIILCVLNARWWKSRVRAATRISPHHVHAVPLCSIQPAPQGFDPLCGSWGARGGDQNKNLLDVLFAFIKN